MSHFAVLGRVDLLTDGTVGSVDAAMGAAIGPYWEFRPRCPWSLRALHGFRCRFTIAYARVIRQQKRAFGHSVAHSIRAISG